MPSLTIFAQLLARPVPTSPPRRKCYLTLADYNATVLRLVTLPNLLLTWRLNTGNLHLAEAEEKRGGQDEEELDIDPEVVDAFQEDLARRGIVIDFVSGGWSPRFVDLALMTPWVAENNNNRPCKTLLLASETIYSPSSLSAFSETLLQLLRKQGKSKSKALIAAKKVYFGVGGGIDEFLHMLGQQRLREREAVHVEQRVEVKTEGVGRVILQVQLQENAD
jgi:protein-histidine N-methyltransferase